MKMEVSKNPQTSETDGTGWWYQSIWLWSAGHWYILTDVWYVVDYGYVAYFYYQGYWLDLTY